MGGCVGRVLAGCGYAPRKRIALCLILLIAMIFTIILINTVTYIFWNMFNNKGITSDTEIKIRGNKVDFPKSRYFNQINGTIEKPKNVISNKHRFMIKEPKHVYLSRLIHKPKKAINKEDDHKSIPKIAVYKGHLKLRKVIPSENNSNDSKKSSKNRIPGAKKKQSTASDENHFYHHVPKASNKVTRSMMVENVKSARLVREDQMEEKLANMQSQIHFLEAMYRKRQEEVISLERQIKSYRMKEFINIRQEITTTQLPTAVASLLKNLTGTRTAAGMQTKDLHVSNSPFVFQLLPHLMNDPLSLRPAYHMKGNRNFSDVVIGVPTVKRDKESYVMITLAHLIDEMSEKERDGTLIVVYVGELDLEYVVNLAKKIEQLFPKHVESGLIEVMSPGPTFYPEFHILKPTLGDSHKRFRWRSKQNLDTMYLMAYAQSKGTYYLMLEDDVIARKDYMKEIKQFTAAVTVSNPGWFFIEYCPVGGIGKLFRSADLVHFITYIQLFFYNLPIDWLLESYLADRGCSINKSSKECQLSKLALRPKYKTSLFQHVGLYSSLKGKIHKVKDPKFGNVPLFYPHDNPPLEFLGTIIEEQPNHTLRDAYEGRNFFWGKKPKEGDFVEFWFKKPTDLASYSFRSSNVKHVTDKFTNTVVEAMPVGRNFTVIGTFDEFGLAEGKIAKGFGPLTAIRLRVKADLQYWVILSEIQLVERSNATAS